MTRATHGTDFFDRDPIRLVGRQGAPRARLIQRTVPEVDGQRILDDLAIRLAGRRDVPIARATDQILVDRQADLARSHDSTQDSAEAAVQRRSDYSGERVLTRVNVSLLPQREQV
jgi:hypothetical protein